MQTVKFFTLGCKVNQYDTQLLREKLLAFADFREIENNHPSDIYIINTCTVTASADKESFELIRRAKKENPLALIIVTGCLAELDSEKIKDIDNKIVILKNKEKKDLLKKLSITNYTNYQLPFTEQPSISYFKGHTRAFLKIQEGCNNFCSYCKVPLVRGKSRSKNPDLIIKEFNTLIKNGYKEIVLCGICLGDFGKDLKPKMELIELLERLDSLEGDFRMRLSSIEAWDITENFIQNINKIKKLCPHLHIPLQSGDDQILKLMNRPINSQGYLEIIKRLKEKIPSLVFTTDVLVGFPQEKEENFLNTLKLIKEIKPLKVHIFSFSPRLYTKAYLLGGKVNDKEIKKRFNLLKEIAREQSLEVKTTFLGKQVRVLFESFSVKNQELFWEGFADNYIKVKVSSRKDLRNRFVKVYLESIEDNYMLGSIGEGDLL